MIPIRTLCLAVAAIGLLHACGGEEPPAPAAGTRPVKTFIVEGGQGDGQRSFPGRVESATRAELSFRVGGTVQDILVKEGDLVEPGQVLARLDPTDYETVVRDRQATFDNSQRNFERARELIEKGFISGTEFDRLEANYKTSEASLEAARQDLAYSELKAPFGGRVAKRHVERFEDVDVKQTVFTLQDVTTLQVKIDLPESLVRGLRSNTPDDPPVPVYATFEGQNDRRLPLTLAEVSTRADPQTQTFEVTFNMAPPEGFVVLPGMTATVTADLSSRLIEAGGSHWVPVSAVVADSALGSRVWVLDPATMTVRAVAVEVGGMQGDQVELRSGLAGGEEIVSVGASYLAEGMRVSRMATGEQAVPRSGDPAGDPAGDPQ
jgi:RND family efflux transporter MFP subunit